MEKDNWTFVDNHEIYYDPDQPILFYLEDECKLGDDWRICVTSRLPSEKWTLRQRLMKVGMSFIKRKEVEKKQEDHDMEIVSRLPNYSNDYPPLPRGPSWFDWLFDTDLLPLRCNGITRADYFTHLPTRVYVNEYISRERTCKRGEEITNNELEKLVKKARLDFSNVK